MELSTAVELNIAEELDVAFVGETVLESDSVGASGPAAKVSPIVVFELMVVFTSIEGVPGAISVGKVVVILVPNCPAEEELTFIRTGVVNSITP